MRTLIVSDDEWITLRLRQGLTQHGCECPPNHTVATDLALSVATAAGADLIVVVLSPDVPRLLDLVGALRGRTRIPILAVGPTTDAHLVLRTLHNGATDYLDLEDLDNELEAGMKRLRSTHSAWQSGWLMAVCGGSGGTGASTLAVNLAAALSREHGKTLLVDLALGGDLAPMLDLKPAHTLADLASNVAQLDRTMFQRSLVAHACGVHLLGAPRNAADHSAITVEILRPALTLARYLFPTVVVDVERSNRQVLETTMKLADLILVPMRLDFTCLRNTRRFLDVLIECGVTRERIRLIANRQGQPNEITQAKIEQALELKVFHQIPDDPRVMNQSNNNGEPAVLGNASSRVSRALIALARSARAELTGEG